VRSWFNYQISEASATQLFEAAMLAIRTCAERIRSLLDIFVHPSTLLKLQSMLNAELVPGALQYAALWFFHLMRFCRQRRKSDGCGPTSLLLH
jgi:hypothetical protein